MPSNNTVSDPKKAFIGDRNVIVYEHLVVEKALKSIANHLTNPHHHQAKQEMDTTLASLIKEVEDKYNKSDLREQIKLIYLFLMEGTKGAVTGTLREPRQEQKSKRLSAITLGLSPITLALLIFRKSGFSALRNWEKFLQGLKPSRIST